MTWLMSQIGGVDQLLTMIADRTNPIQKTCNVDSLDATFKIPICSFNDLTYSEIKKRVLNNVDILIKN
tara:strand:+ start:577 stop:780 length:204 start_codon:yes stop_codon:yes gene_type:complete